MSAFRAAGSRRRTTVDDEDDLEYQRERQNEINAERARQQRIRDRVPGKRINGKARAGDIDAVLDQVKDGWEFVVDPDFNNVDLALQLLDNPSLGKDMESFRKTKNMLSKALKGSVDKHYQAFAAALPHHSALLSHVSATQAQITDARSVLVESKESLGARRADLVQLWTRGQTLEEMMKILDQIEHLKLVPDLLETLISEKRLLQAAVLLVRSLKIINNPDMLDIGAVSDLRGYLNGQETALKDILLDELHAHLYLKSFWCESRWSAYVPGQQSLPKTEYDEESNQKSDSKPSISASRPARLHRFLTDLMLKPNDPPHDLNEPHSSGKGLSNIPNTGFQVSGNTVNPEADSFSYIELLLESLAVLAKLGTVLDTVTQRLPTEIFNLVEATIDEVEERAEYGRRATIMGSLADSEAYGVAHEAHGDGRTLVIRQNGFTSVHLRLAALEMFSKRVDHEIVKDLFWTLYSKFDAVAQGLRVVYEVVNRIGSRRDFKDSLGTKPGTLFPVAELWGPVQDEIRTLIRDYLTNEEQGSASRRNPISSINETLREGKFGRDKIKPVFRLGDTDPKLLSKVLKPHEDELNRLLKDTMPGLVSGTSENTVNSSLMSTIVDDRFSGVGHHRLLISPDAFHVSIIFQPTHAFLSRVADVLPSGEASGVSATMLDEFVLKVYLPQLEEKVTVLFHQAVTGPDSFQPDPTSAKLSSEPLVRASTQLMALINSLCSMYRATPFHQESYSRLILSVIIQFYQRCSDYFQSLVSMPGKDVSMDSEIALAARWAQKAELNPCLTELLVTSESDTAKQQQLCRQETNIELELLRQTKIRPSDLIPSIKNLAALASLYHSVSWFATELGLLRNSADEIISPTSPRPRESPILETKSPVVPVSSSEELKLPLTREMAMRLQALLKTYEQLSGLILDCIRIDVRCRSIYYLESAMKEGNYTLDYEASEPDPYIMDLNSELGQCDSLVSTRLPQQARQYVFVGLGYLLEHMLIQGARYLKRPNVFGIKKVMRNALALQQSIKMLTHEHQHTEFERAKQYYSLFSLSPQTMLDSIRQSQPFTFDEYQIMLNLQCGVDPSEGEAGIPKATDRNYSMYLIDLHGLEIESGNS
ncbi:hypothetical protein BDN72DRAFT_784268 [Pluteus cervinus]|uniref:Uncharacterized protein n=1 Tax=Pluteus cervinus TaxID=181527 RepID=A0ACD3BHN2_9AGAR|nr:hypothetical protein BDN72DRAFT_784268 [Pluteus cervinus]